MSLRVVVTGGNRGLGRDIVRWFGNRGDHVYVNYRSDRQSAEAVVSEVVDAGGSATAVAADVTSPEMVTEMTEAVLADGGVDVLVNNVGPFQRSQWDQLSPQDWSGQLDGSVTAAFLVTRALIESLRARGGKVINVSDSAADSIRAQPDFLPYYIGKTGLLILTRSVAVAEAGNGVGVYAVLPGVMENSAIKPEESAVPAGRFGNAADLSGVLDLIVSADGEYLTGTFFQVGGGWNL